MIPEAALIAATSAVAGGLAVGLTSFATTWLQTRSQRRNDLLRIALEAGIREYDAVTEELKRRGGPMAPLGLWVWFNLEILRLAETNALTPETVSELQRRSKELNAAQKFVAYNRT